MQATRLVAFGCSITYGHGLEDCLDAEGHPGKFPSEFAWPALLGRAMNLPVDNRGVAGASNLQILYNILNYKFAPGDVAVLMWSYADRDMIFNDRAKPIQMGVWLDTALAKNWIMTHSLADNAIRSWLYVHHANLFLKSLNIPVYNFFAHYKQLDQYKPDYIDVVCYDVKVEYLRHVDKAKDNSHPGPQAHQTMANEMFGIIK